MTPIFPALGSLQPPFVDVVSKYVLPILMYPLPLIDPELDEPLPEPELVAPVLPLPTLPALVVFLLVVPLVVPVLLFVP